MLKELKEHETILNENGFWLHVNEKKLVLINELIIIPIELYLIIIKFILTINIIQVNFI